MIKLINIKNNQTHLINSTLGYNNNKNHFDPLSTINFNFSIKNCKKIENQTVKKSNTTAKSKIHVQ